MKIKDRILRSIANRKDKAFVRSEFDRFGSSASVNTALRELAQDGFLVRVGTGVYTRGAVSRLSGRIVPAAPPEDYVKASLLKLGVDLRPGQDMLNYNAGKTTQIPAGLVYDTGNRRISRRFVAKVVYENNFSRAASTRS